MSEKNMRGARNITRQNRRMVKQTNEMIFTSAHLSISKVT